MTDSSNRESTVAAMPGSRVELVGRHSKRTGRLLQKVGYASSVPHFVRNEHVGNVLHVVSKHAACFTGRLGCRVESSLCIHGRLLAALFLLLSASAVQAQLPSTRLGSIFPAGVKVGESIDVVISGADLDDVVQLHFSHPGITAKQKLSEPGPFDKGPQPVVNTFVVTAAGNTPPGFYEARAVGRYGVSNPRIFVVSDLPQAAEIEPNNSVETATELPASCDMAGRSNQQGDVDYFKLAATAGQRLIISAQAHRIDSRMAPVMIVYDALGRELDNSRNSVRGDPLVDFTAPAAGVYTLKVYDALYNGSEDHFYRLRVGVLPHIDFVFPPAGEAGGNRPFTLFGRNLPGGQPAGLTIDGKPIQKLGVSIPLPAVGTIDELAFSSMLDPDAGGLDGKEYRVASPQGLSTPVMVGVSAGPITLEQEPNNTPDKSQKVTLPVEIAGQFYPQRDHDWFQFDAKLGDDLVIEVVSQRLGLPCDPNLLVQRVVKPAEAGQPEQVAVVAAVDDVPVGGVAEFDTRTFDPVYRFTAPADGVYRVLVRDSYSEVTNDPRNSYRLTIRKPLPGFRLAAASGNPTGGALNLRKGGSTEIRVVAYRHDGFDGEITVTATGLPGGVTCPAVVIGPANDSTTLVLTATDNAPPGMGLIQMTGESKIGATAVKQVARFGTPIWPLPVRQPNTPQATGPARIARNLVVSVSADEVSPILLQAGADKLWEGSRAAVLKIPYTLTRRGEFKGLVQCLASQLPPNVDSPVFTINPDQTAGEFQINLKNTTPVGTHTFYLSALVQPVPYVRNPDAAKKAADRKVEIDAIVVDLTAKSQAATTAKAAADKMVADTTQAVQVATTAKAAADKAVVDTATAAKAAVELAAKAKAAAAASPTDTNLAAAATAAQKGADDAAVSAKAAADAAVVAQKGLDDATAKAKTAADDKVLKDKEADAAAKLLVAGQAAKVEAEKRAVDTANIAKPQPINNVYLPSTPVTIQVTPAPVTLAVGAPSVSVKQGAMIELPATIQRLYGFADAVTLSVILPPGVAGLTIANVAIPNGQNAGKLVIAAAANATDGTHAVTVRAALALNGQPLTVDQPVTLKIEKVEATK